MAWDKFVELVAKEWTVISSAPITFFVLLGIALFVISKAASMWHRKQISDLQSACTNKDSLNSLLQKQLEYQKTEVAGMQTKLDEARKMDKTGEQALPIALVPIEAGSPQVRDAFLKLTSGAGLQLKLDPTKREPGIDVVYAMSEDDLNVLAAARHLVDMGLVGSVKESAPGMVTAVGSAAAADLRQVWDEQVELKGTHATVSAGHLKPHISNPEDKGG